MAFKQALAVEDQSELHLSVLECLKLRLDQLASGDSLALIRGMHKVGIQRDVVEFDMEAATFGRQRQSQWCWAACSQMLSKYLGIQIPQEAFVQKMNGMLIDRPANGHLEIVNGLSDWIVQQGSGLAMTQASLSEANAQNMIALMRSEKPAILVIKPTGSGHAVVLTGMTYDIDPVTLAEIPRTVIYRDPWPDNPSRQEVSWEKFLSIQEEHGAMITVDLLSLKATPGL